MMASAKEVTNCPNCSKDYQENADFVPIILPYFHTFCKNYVRNLSANETSLKCYDCESRHRMPKGTTPPVNKCFIAYIQFNEDDTCTVHEKNSVYFCRCKVFISPPLWYARGGANHNAFIIVINPPGHTTMIGHYD